MLPEVPGGGDGEPSWNATSKVLMTYSSPYGSVAKVVMLKAGLAAAVMLKMETPPTSGGQYCAHFGRPFSITLVHMTMTPMFCCQIMVQKSPMVFGSGPGIKGVFASAHESVGVVI